MARPLFCPNKSCSCHIDPDTPESTSLRKMDWFKRSGTYFTKVRGEVQRYTCKRCGRGFSDQTFSLDYYVKRIINYNRLADSLESCASVRACARTLGCSCDSVTNRTSRFARQCISLHSRFLSTVEQQEDMAADGFESFAVSQYYPNNIHLAVGSTSQFLYFCDYVTIRRKGTMTAFQSRVREALETLYRSSPQALTASFAELLEHVQQRYLASSYRPMTLHTDEKSEYRRALSKNDRLCQAIAEKGFAHNQISSRAKRTKHNPLFPVNYLDRELRKDLAEHVRETVRFARNVNHSMERLWIYAYRHNFKKRFRINDPVTVQRTHGEQTGGGLKTMRWLARGLTSRRRFLSFEKLEKAQGRVWRREHVTPLKGIVRGALREITRQAIRGPVDLEKVRTSLDVDDLMREVPQYLPKYALM